ncbi:hypothetical protein G6F50_014000 [Rhizopus delemar]|uniref:Uncharacterized protein n=1 Tax=Rhizopus delemar TaxID=936053 RepID=A0A9P7CAF6_9FUNG|nr:hypothetical protein G6F50_014000 [Rhizopus delemar]
MQFGQVRQQVQQVLARGIEARVDLLDRNVVATGCHPRRYAGDVQFDVGQAAEPDRDVVPFAGLAQQARNGVAAQRGLESEVGAVGHRLAQATGAFLPRFGVGLGQRPASLHQAPGERIRVEPAQPFGLQPGTQQRTLASAIDAGQHQDPPHRSERTTEGDLAAATDRLAQHLAQPLATLQAGQGLVELAAQAQQLLAARPGVTTGGLGQQFLVGADVHDHRFGVVVVGDDQRLLLAHGAHQARPTAGLHRRGRGLFKAGQIQRQGHGTAPGRGGLWPLYPIWPNWG